MIEQRYLLFNNDYIFINPNSMVLSMMCIPDTRADSSQIGRFMTDLLKSVKFDERTDCSFKTPIYEYNFDYAETEEIYRFFVNLKNKRQNVVPGPVAQSAPAMPSAMPSADSAPAKPSPVRAATPVPAPLVSVAPNAQPKQTQSKSSLFSFGGFKKKKDAQDDVKKTEPPVIKEKKSVLPADFSGLAIPGLSTPSSSDAPVMSRPKVEKRQAEAVVPHEPPKPAPVRLVQQESDESELTNETVFLAPREFSQAASLVAYDGTAIGISGEVFTIGRGGKTGVHIDLLIESKTVGRFHASIYNENGSYYLVDNDSTNGTYLNNIRLKPGVKTLLSNGAKIRFSDTTYTFTSV